MKAVAFRIILALGSLLMITEVSFGQAVSGSILGTVSDASDAAVQNAAIETTDLDHGTVYKATSNESSNYEQTHLLAGRYKVSAPGFSPFEVTTEVQIDSSTRTMR